MAAETSSVRFSEFSVQGFRRLCNVRLPLRPMAVMIGANGTGKTSVLDVLTLLANSAQGKLNDSIAELSGLGGILTYDRAEELRIGMAVGGSFPNSAIPTNPRSFILIREVQTLGISNWTTIGCCVRSPLESSLAQVPKMFREPEDFRNRLSSSSFYHVLDVGPRLRFVSRSP